LQRPISPNFVTKCSSVSRRGIRKDTFENFHFRGHLPPKSEIENWSNRHITQSRLQVMGCTTEKYCCSPRAREFPRSINFSLKRMVAELWCVKVAQFSYFALFSLYKTPKTYLPVTSLQPRGFIAESMIFPCGSRRSKGVPSRTGDFLRILLGSWGPPNLPKFLPMANGYTHT